MRKHMRAYSAAQIFSDAWPRARTSLGLKRGDALAQSTVGVAVRGNGGERVEGCSTVGPSITQNPCKKIESGHVVGRRPPLLEVVRAHIQVSYTARL